MQDLIVGFARLHGDAAMLVTVPRLVSRLLLDADRIAINPRQLRDSFLLPPQQLIGRRLRPLLADGMPIPSEKQIPLDSLLTDFPVSVLYTADSA
jgi:maltooligosyltrehalose synthase